MRSGIGDRWSAATIRSVVLIRLARGDELRGPRALDRVPAGQVDHHARPLHGLLEFGAGADPAPLWALRPRLLGMPGHTDDSQPALLQKRPDPATDPAVCARHHDVSHLELLRGLPCA